MKRTSTMIAVMIAAILLTGLLAVLPAQASAASPNPIGPSPVSGSIVAAPAYTYTTVITVTSGRDIDTSMSTTCSTSPCTLRRAIVQARNVTAGQRPVLIRFNIPTTETQSYSSTLGIWHIYLLSTSDASVLRRLNGNIIIDGATQPGGRVTGPKIFVVGPTTGQKDGPVVGDVAGNDGHVIRGLGFQNFGTHLIVNTDNNLIENNWFGLNDEAPASICAPTIHRTAVAAPASTWAAARAARSTTRSRTTSSPDSMAWRQLFAAAATSSPTTTWAPAPMVT
jgi:hypothetical protein